jgi:hypothetical protein
MPPEVVENFQIIGDGAEQARQRAGDSAEQKVSYAGKKNFLPIRRKSWEHRQG